jgi:hypothetical protein
MEEVEHRKCHNCGEASVYSITEACDIINDYEKLKDDYQVLVDTLNAPDEYLAESDWSWEEEGEDFSAKKNRQLEFFD